MPTTRSSKIHWVPAYITNVLTALLLLAFPVVGVATIAGRAAGSASDPMPTCV